jgi:hypothetical protein
MFAPAKRGSVIHVVKHTIAGSNLPLITRHEERTGGIAPKMDMQLQEGSNVVVKQFRSGNLWKWLESTFGEFYPFLR